jgi:hypothetical protein
VKESSQQVYFIESQDAVDNFKSILTVKEEKAHDNSNSEKMLVFKSVSFLFYFVMFMCTID